MSNRESIQRVRIYLSERDQAESQPLYLAALDRLRREGATGATVLRGVAGFGAGQRLHTAALGDFSEAPLVIEWVDRTERVGRILPALDGLLGDALVTVEDVRVYRAVLRSSGPFGERTVGQLMKAEPAAARPDTPLRDAAELMIEHAQALLPVLNPRGTIVGTLGAAELEGRGELALPLRLLAALAEAERRALLERLPARALAELMASDPRTISNEASIPQALSPMIEWGLDTLPVLDREGRLVGLFGVEQALRAAVRDTEPAEAAVRDAEPPTPVGLVMQRAVPAVPSSAPLAAVAGQLLAAPDRFVVVLDEGKPIGAITDLSLIQRLAEPARSAWLALLRAPAAPHPGFAEGLSAALLAERDVPMLGEQAPQDEAIRLMLAGGHERLIVVSADGRLAGVLTRRGLLRALAQAVG